MLPGSGGGRVVLAMIRSMRLTDARASEDAKGDSATARSTTLRGRASGSFSRQASTSSSSSGGNVLPEEVQGARHVRRNHGQERHRRLCTERRRARDELVEDGAECPERPRARRAPLGCGFAPAPCTLATPVPPCRAACSAHRYRASPERTDRTLQSRALARAEHRRDDARRRCSTCSAFDARRPLHGLPQGSRRPRAPRRSPRRPAADPARAGSR